MSSFIRPVGVHRDINELEYISALLQSHQHILRHSGTIKPVDIVWYLKSRYGIIVSEDIVQQCILTELVGQIHDQLLHPPDDEEVERTKKLNEKKMKKKEREDNRRSKTSNTNTNINSSSMTNQLNSEVEVEVEESQGLEDNDDDDKKKEHINQQYMDICQLTAILLIPELVQETSMSSSLQPTKGGRGGRNLQRQERGTMGNEQIFQPFIDAILAVIQKDTTSTSMSNSITTTKNSINRSSSIVLSATILRQLFDSVHEYNISNDVIQEMLAAVHSNNNNPQQQKEEEAYDVADVDADHHQTATSSSSTTIVIEPHDLIDVLVRDVIVMYQQHENDFSNTTDLVKGIVARTASPTSPLRASLQQQQQLPVSATDKPATTTTDTTTSTSTIQQVNTAPFIDFSSDTFRRPMFGMQLWVAGIAAYFAYIEPVENNWIVASCSSSTIGCNVAKGVASWFALFLQIVTLGLPYVLLGSVGNANYSNIRIYRFIGFLVGSCVICAVLVLSYTLKIETDAFVTSGNKDQFDPEYYCSDIYEEDAKQECIAYCYQNRLQCTTQYVLAADFSGFAYFIALLLGCSLLLTQFVDTILTILPKLWVEGDGILLRWSLPGTVRQERSGKAAASFRMKQMLNNALEIAYDRTLYSSSVSNSKLAGSSITSAAGTLTKADRAKTTLERFLLLPIKTEKVGGIFWAWRRIWDGRIFAEEGIWLNGRLLTCNFAQCSIFGVLGFLTRVLYYYQEDFFYTEEEKKQMEVVEQTDLEISQGNYTVLLGDSYYEFIDCAQQIMGVDLVAESDLYYIDFTTPYGFVGYVTSYYTTFENATMALLPCAEEHPEVAQFFNNTNTASTYESDGLKDLVSGFEITPSRYIAAAWCGLFAGFLVITYIAILLIPSFITTVMQFRSGVRGSLKDPEFLRLRYAMDTVTVLLGSAFWGTIVTAIGAMFFTVGVIFLIGLLPLIIGAVLGFVIILSLRLGVLMTLRGIFFSAFYRKRPGAANIMFIVLEVWNIALTLGFVAIRAIKLVVLAIMYIARIDTPFLARGIGRFGPVELDSISIAFEKDLLIHEAHRHILIERFGLLCLLKLYSGNEFATRAGSAWRLLFVLITMPWLQKYRVAQSVMDLEDELQQIQDDMEEEGDVFVKEKKLLQLQDVQSQMDVMNATQGSVQEIEALRRRNEYLEEKIRALELHQKKDSENEDACDVTTVTMANTTSDHDPNRTSNCTEEEATNVAAPIEVPFKEEKDAAVHVPTSSPSTTMAPSLPSSSEYLRVEL